MSILNDFNTNLRIRENELRLIKIQYEKRIKFLKKILVDVEFICNKKVNDAEFKWKDTQASHLHYREGVNKTILTLQHEKESERQAGIKSFDRCCSLEKMNRELKCISNRQEEELLQLTEKNGVVTGKLILSEGKLKKALSEIKKLKGVNKDG